MYFSPSSTSDFHLHEPHIQRTGSNIYLSLAWTDDGLCLGYLKTTITFTVTGIQFIFFLLSARHDIGEDTSGTRHSDRTNFNKDSEEQLSR
jgi:hypothetical protein